MTQTELLADLLARNGEILKVTLADFSDSDMLVRPVPGANHTAWQMVHLIGSAAFMFGTVAPGIVPQAASALAAKFGNQSAGIDDPAAFPTRAQLIELFSQVQTAAVNWAKTLEPADLEKSTGERLAQFAPTVGHLIAMAGGHILMHVGQMQVIRRKLGKPLLF